MKALFITIAALLLVAAQAQWIPVDDELILPSLVQKNDRTILETIGTLAPLKLLNELVSNEGFEEIRDLLNSSGNFTLFAPNNDAIALAHLNSSHTSLISTILRYHVVNSTMKSGDFGVLTLPPTLLDNDTVVHLGGEPQVLQVAKLLGKLFVPFGIPGELTFTASVSQSDIGCSNGVIHVIDKVIIPPHDIKFTLFRGGLTSMMTALFKTGVMKELEEKNKVTVFAPSNDAFFGVDFTKLTEDQIIEILKYHVVEDVFYSPDLYNGQELQTWSGQTLTVKKFLFGFGVNHAQIEVPNALMSNGVVHIIDSLLCPPSMKDLVLKK